MKLNQPEEALNYFKKAQEQNRALCDSHEVVNVTQMGLALGYYRLGLAADRTGNTVSAQKYYSYCLDLRDMRLREVEAANMFATNNRTVMDARIDRMLAQARCHRIDEVIKFVDVLLQQAATVRPVNPDNAAHAAEANELKAHYQVFAGEGLSIMVEYMAHSDPRRKELIAKAVDAVRLAVANGFENLWYLENDPDFDGIRPDSGYQAALQTLRQKQRPKE
jgi:hypothetical protein